jgi:spore germination cell wall hydrolase CwlJ-like protein
MIAAFDRKSVFSALAALAIVTASVVGSWFSLRALAGDALEAQRHAAELDRLPGRPDEAPVLAAEAPAFAPDDARARNAAIPFFAGKLDPAAPFRFSGSPQDQSRAIECLALAAMAEAGPSDPGQRAVIQVVLNRVRHPAFAKTVCGVVFQGSERRTGCQFSFTCDGSLARRYSDKAWEVARLRAGEMLAGKVYAPVSNATHYHTDWVHPYWSPKLVKLAQVETHLFFRWPGYWGSNAALRTAYRGGEPDPFSAPAEIVASSAPEVVAPAVVPSDTPPISGGAVTMRDPTGMANFVVLDPGSDAASALAIARKLCREGATCRVLGWASRSEIPASFPLTPASRARLQFSFTRDPSGAEYALYDCRRFVELPYEKCMPKVR